MPAHPDAVPAIMEASGKAPAAKAKEAASAPSPAPAASSTLEPQRVSSPGRKPTPEVITKQQPLFDDFELGRELGHGYATCSIAEKAHVCSSFAVVREGIRKSDGEKVLCLTVWMAYMPCRLPSRRFRRRSSLDQTRRTSAERFVAVLCWQAHSRQICNLASLDHPNVMKLYEVSSAVGAEY
jgi:hypothetical protein